MSQEVEGQKVDARKRKFLIAATSAVGGVAAAAVAVPLVMSMMPSARAKAAGAPVEVDISKVEPGMLLTVVWRGKPVWIVNRTPEMLTMLGKH
ncbi:MAG: ubiquinol-cytochrome c reductase iron-sulfur subunit, partial [Rubrivivax sp.]|nr:ubiquinol-cytochrome c reductase iron-sulfur subunit [Rubrivivax sp.]